MLSQLNLCMLVILITNICAGKLLIPLGSWITLWKTETLLKCRPSLLQVSKFVLVLIPDLRGLCKCFTYATKTIANLTTYSRKPGDYNGTIIFEIDIMKNSSPLNLKFTFFATVKTKITLLFCWTHSTLSSASKCDRVNQNKRNNQKICEKVKFDKDLN